jgi:O-antigen/teichoic acid export membrane protein
MENKFNRAIILIFSRLTNSLVLLVSPIFLVRLLKIEQYGQYREFILFSMLFINIFSFAIQYNLIYFISKNPDKEKQLVSNTAIMLFFSSVIGIGTIMLIKDIIISKTSYNFIYSLIIYFFFSLNLDFLESYWLGKKQSNLVFFYSTLRILFRVISVVIISLMLKSVTAIITSIIFIEIVRFLTVLMFLLYKKLFILQFDKKLFLLQMGYLGPLGFSNVIYTLNREIGKLLISVQMGVEYLALYAIGNYQVPIIGIIRSSVSDIIFPEMVEQYNVNSLNNLQIWQKSNIVFCYLVFPIFMIFFCFSSTIIEILFTEQYLEAVPIFRIYLTILLIQCFDTGLPLRVINKTKYYFSGNLYFLIVNFISIIVLYRIFGFIGPALAYVFGFLGFTCYLSWKIKLYYKIDLKSLFLWKKVFSIILLIIICCPFLYIGRYITSNNILNFFISSSLYLSIFYLLLYFFHLEEFDILVTRIKKTIKKYF